MSDQERKGKSKERAEDEEESSAEETSTKAAEKDADEAEERDEESDESEDEESEDEGGAKAGSDDDESEDDGDAKAAGSDDEDSEDESEEKGADAARAQRVAAALGVADEGAEAKDEEATEEAPAAPANRAARRAEAAQRRKKRKGGAGEKSEKSADDADAPLPKDKNARAKELLKRRREQAAEARPIQLLPGEMVDDALARSGSAISKWIRTNFTVIQWVVLGALAAGGVFLFYQGRVDKAASGATGALMAGVSADRGRVMAEDKRSDEEKEGDPTKVFKTAEERSDTALAAYKKVVAQHKDTAVGTLARLGEAGDYLDKHEYVPALEGFSAVASSSLAGADPDVKARALEGLGFAKEGKGDIDGALTTFKELEGIAGYKELGLYHQGRVYLAKGDKEKAKGFLKQAHDKLEQPTTEGQGLHYLQNMTDEALRRIDPSLVPQKGPSLGGGPKGGPVSAEQIEKIKRQLEEAMKQKGDKH